MRTRFVYSTSAGFPLKWHLYVFITCPTHAAPVPRNYIIPTKLSVSAFDGIVHWLDSAKGTDKQSSVPRRPPPSAGSPGPQHTWVYMHACMMYISYTPFMCTALIHLYVLFRTPPTRLLTCISATGFLHAEFFQARSTCLSEPCSAV